MAEDFRPLSTFRCNEAILLISASIIISPNVRNCGVPSALDIETAVRRCDIYDKDAQPPKKMRKKTLRWLSIPANGADMVFACYEARPYSIRR